MRRRLKRLGFLALVSALLAAGGAKPAVVLPNEAAFSRELSALQADGATVVVHFWATWCGVCVEEFRTLGPTLSKISKHGAKVMLVSLDESEQAEVAVPAFLRKNEVVGLSYLLEDADPEAMARAIDPNWPAGALPATFIFQAGKRTKSFYGTVEASELLRAIKSELKK